MPLGDLIILSLIVSAFGLFFVVLLTTTIVLSLPDRPKRYAGAVADQPVPDRPGLEAA